MGGLREGGSERVGEGRRPRAHDRENGRLLTEKLVKEKIGK